MEKKEVNSERTKAAVREGNEEGELPDETLSGHHCHSLLHLTFLLILPQF